MHPEFRSWQWPPGDWKIAAQKLAVSQLEWACKNGKVATDDERYRSVLEGRVYKPPSSSCGDLAHWMLYRMGVRLPWINRKENAGWRPGENVSLLCWNIATRASTAADVYAPGDVIVVWTRASAAGVMGNEHVVCVIDHDPQSGVLQTAEYGQPGGALKTSELAIGGGHHILGTRTVHRWLPLQDVLGAAAAAGRLEPAEEPIPAPTPSLAPSMPTAGLIVQEPSILAVAGLEHTTADFRRALVAMCGRIGCNPDHIATCISFETGATFSPSIRNAQSGAIGLIQFMGPTALALGTNRERLAAMTPIEQLAYVERYFAMHAGRLHSLDDCYLAIFMPVMIGRPGSTVVFNRGQVGYDQNSGFDRAKKGAITIDDIVTTVRGVAAKAGGRRLPVGDA